MFLSKIKASGDRSAWGDFWFQPTGSMTGAGMRVSPDSAMRLAAVYACVRVLCESMAVLPFRLYRKKVGGGRALVTDHWLHQLFARRPNRFQTPFEWKEMVEGHVVLRGNAFNEIVEDGRGGILELLPLHPDRMKIELLDNGSWRYNYTGRNGVEKLYRRDQIWHLRGLSSDGISGLNPIELQREAIAAGLGAQEYGNRFFANDAKPSGGWIEFPGKFSDLEAKKKFRESWQQMQGGSNRSKTAVLENGMKFHEIGVNNKDSQFIESKAFSVAEIARMFRVPPHLIGDLTKATFSNIEQQSLDFVTHTMTPWAERWESSIETMLLGTDQEANQDLEVEFDFSILLRADAAARSTYYHNGIQDGWLVRNEARAREGLDPIDGLDEPLRPLNMVEESEAEAEPGDDKTALPPEPSDAPADARLKAVLTSNAGRLARRLVKSWPVEESFAEQLAEGLGIEREAALAWMSRELFAKETFNEEYVAAALLRLAGVTP